jgi:hypothetical protein
MLEYLEQESSIELASKAFHWVVHSGRPLHLEEVVEALALDENEKRLDLNITFSDPRDLLRVSSSLLYEADLVNEVRMRKEQERKEWEELRRKETEERRRKERDSGEEDAGKADSGKENSEEENSVAGDLGAGDSDEVSKKCIRLCHYTVEVCIIRTTLGRLFS